MITVKQSLLREKLAPSRRLAVEALTYHWGVRPVEFWPGWLPPLSLIHISEPTRQAESRMPSSA